MWKLPIIFDWILLSSAISIILIFIILLIKLIFKNRQGANWHYYIWFILLVKLIIPYAPESSVSILNVITPTVINLFSTQNSALINAGTGIAQQEQNEAIITGVQLTLTQQAPITQSSIQQTADNGLYNIRGNSDLKLKFIMFWLIGVLIFGAYIAFINLRLLLKIRMQPRLNNESINQILNECKLTLKIHSEIPIITADVHTPSIFGFIKTKLLMPPDILKKVNDDELKHIFLHELSHLKRKDNVINWIVVLLKVLHWFNPIIWYGFYRMHQDCEIACDALVLSCMDQKKQIQYGHTIINLLKMTSGSQSIPGTVGILTDKSQVKRRIIMITLYNKKSYIWSAAGVIILIVLSCIMLTNAKNSSTYSSAVIVPDTNIVTSLSYSDSQKEAASGDSNSVIVKDVKGNHFNGKLMVVSDPAKIVVGYSLQNSKPDKTTSEMAKEANAAGAINAGAFKIDDSAAGFIIKDGKIVYDELKNDIIKQDTIGFTDKGKLLVGRFSLPQLKDFGVKEAVSFGPPLIIDSIPAIKNGDGGWGLAPRTAIGQKADGTVLLLVINGFSIQESIGATLKNVQDILLEEGAVNAALLDGGSSSAMYYNGKIINRPIVLEGDRFIPERERIIPSTFLVLP